MLLVASVAGQMDLHFLYAQGSALQHTHTTKARNPILDFQWYTRESRAGLLSLYTVSDKSTRAMCRSRNQYIGDESIDFLN